MNIQQENYLHLLTPQKREILCKFRISSHDLEIERGHYYKIDVDNRICKLYNIKVEDKIHFLLEC